MVNDGADIYVADTDNHRVQRFTIGVKGKKVGLTLAGEGGVDLMHENIRKYQKN
jgi:hypothetical protein